MLAEVRYELAVMQQKLKNDKKRMFRAVPGSKEHRGAVVTYDRNYVELRYSKSLAKKLFNEKEAS